MTVRRGSRIMGNGFAGNKMGRITGRTIGHTMERTTWHKTGHIMKYTIASSFVTMLAATLVILLVAAMFYSVVSGGIGSVQAAEYPAATLGEIYSITTNPEEPRVLEEFTISIGVRSTADRLGDYALDVFVIKNGKVEDNNSFAFSLQPGKTVVFSTEFSPSAVGEYEIFTKLYDKYKTIVYHTRISNVTVASDIGPFDLFLDVLSRRVRPNEEIPMLLTVKNAGTKGTDVEVVVSMDCWEHEDAEKSFSVFLKGGATFEKSMTITSCNEIGKRRITAEAVLFDASFATSSNDIFINRTHYDLNVEFPTPLKIRQGGSKTLGVIIKNTAGTAVNNLKLMVENIPLEWAEITPSVISSVSPNETAIFIVNISVPKDAAIVEYPITIAIGSDETLVQKESVLNVISGEFAAEEESGNVPSLFGTIESKLAIISMAVAAAMTMLAIAILRGRRARKSGKYVMNNYYYRKDNKAALKKIKDIIERR